MPVGAPLSRLKKARLYLPIALSVWMLIAATSIAERP